MRDLDAILDAPGLDLPALRGALVEERQARVSQDGHDGRALAESLTGLVDHTVVRLFRRALDVEPPSVALFALGGYGRAELAPFSDVDVLALYRDIPTRAIEGVVTPFVQWLWDAGLEPGHAFRSLNRSAESMTADLKAATAMLEARFLAGDQRLREDLEQQVLAPFRARHGEGFARAKLEEMEARHRDQGGSACVKEPEVKEGQGGLRDVHFIDWVALARGTTRRDLLREAAGVTPEDLEGLEAARGLLLTVRARMHTLEGRRVDRLEMALQPRVAAAAGYRDSPEALAVEGFMRDYYLAARQVERMAEHVAALVRRRRGPLGVRRPITDELAAVDLRLYFRREGLPGAAPPGFLLEVFQVAQRQELQVSDEVLEAVRRDLGRVDDEFRSDPAHAAAFLSILQGSAGVASALYAMHRSGLLGEYLPEFGALSCLVQFDAYHEYTVDEHTLHAVRNIEAFEHAQAPEDTARRTCLHMLARPDLVRLVLLLHDTGKAKGGNHVEASTAMVPQVARRLGLPQRDAEHVHFLVENHLLMSATAEHRDLSEGATIRAFAERVGGLERLGMLYLVTCADIMAVGHGAWTRWKDALVTDLYRKTAELLAGAPMAAPGSYLERVLAAAGPTADRDAIGRHLERVPERYALEVEPAAAARHPSLVAGLEGRAVTMDAEARGEGTTLWICTRDRPLLFAQLAGCLAARGLNIVGAYAYTRSDGVVLDRFDVSLEEADRADPRVWGRTEETLAQVLGGQADLDALLARRARRVPDRPRFEQPRPRRVLISNKVSPRYTVVDVSMQDRIGLLHGLAAAIGRMGCDIHFARATTRANLAVDVFYVSRGGLKLASDEEQQALRDALLAV
ncbi:MAG: [protein-PII] uridylyltransferase [Planctomycetes bacterium]|nr:[protein-PII] uridylyltransferase [Planctomycetota bacterium]